jgi:major membrane immunogen (membrane-anchored lipoprotein)|tara:strand:+ start:1584 stop:3080 length:1497 start_codon:yes stop_codon:yes gene_type:complete
MTTTLDQVLNDPLELISRLKIKDKKGKYKKFGEVITPEQIDIINTIHSHDRIAIVKARQMGITTAVRGYCFWEVFSSPESLNSSVVSNKHNSACELLKIDRRFFNTLPKPLRRTMQDRKDRLTFSSTDSSLMAASAQSDSQDRGFTMNTAHLSEYAFYDNPEEYLASMVASINDGKIIIESTANHYQDALHRICLDANYNDRWKVIFLPWSSFPQYRKALPKGGFEMDHFEKKLAEEHNLTEEQIFWRREKIKEIKDERLFRREFPITIEEAYSLSDDNYFTDVHFEHIEKIEINNETVTVLEEYDPRDSYILGVDVGGGTGGDYSCGIILSRISHSPVAIISSNTLSVHDFTIACMNLAKRYRAQICFESNNHGAGFKEVLNANSWHQYREFLTTKKSKIQIYEHLRNFLEEQMIFNLDDKTFTELRGLVKDNKGLAPSAPSGLHDDRAMALAIGLYHLRDVPMPKSDWDRAMLRAPVRNKQPRTAHPLKQNRSYRR